MLSKTEEAELRKRFDENFVQSSDPQDNGTEYLYRINWDKSISIALPEDVFDFLIQQINEATTPERILEMVEIDAIAVEATMDYYYENLTSNRPDIFDIQRLLTENKKRVLKIAE